jgi:hypothetical protein
MPEIKAKPWWKSRTVWFNVASAIVTLAAAPIGLSPATAAIVTAVGNVVLRTTTSGPVTTNQATADAVNVEILPLSRGL